MPIRQIVTAKKYFYVKTNYNKTHIQLNSIDMVSFIEIAESRKSERRERLRYASNEERTQIK